MKRLRNFLAATMLGAAALSPSARALDLSDVWWKADESGWAAYVSHHRDTIGFALLVYDAQGQPLYVTGGLRMFAITNPGGFQVFSGTLYASTGPSYGGPFNPDQVTRRVVGTAIFEPRSATTATLQYTIDGVTVTKTVSRMTMQTKDIGGSYRHLQRLDYPGNMPDVERRAHDSGQLEIDHDGSAIKMRFQGQQSQCEYNGTYVQLGRHGEITGTYACNTGIAGAFRITEVEHTQRGLSGRFTTLQGMPGFIRGSFSAIPLS